MKKFINQVEQVEKELIGGLCKAKPNLLKVLPDSNIIVRAQRKKDKPAIVFGCGSGHEPAPGGYVGYGMLDAAVPGSIFSSPTPDRILQAIRAVANEAGVLCVIMNYTGDVMNFRMAIEMAQMEGLAVDSVTVADDVCTPPSKATGRRGLAGAILINKIAGAEAEMGVGLQRVKSVAEWAISGLRTIGVAIAPCIVPSEGEASFELGPDEMEIGMGLHGEPGILRAKMMSADKTAEYMLERLMTDYSYKGCEVVVLLNGLGGTPVMELYLLNNFIADYLASRGVRVYDTLIGNYMTSMEMKGFSISLLRLDPHLKALYDAPCHTQAFRR